MHQIHHNKDVEALGVLLPKLLLDKQAASREPLIKSEVPAVQD